MIDSLIQQCRRFFRYRAKELEFRYRTWRNKREIHRAYAAPPAVVPALRFWLPRVGAAAAACAVVFACVFLAVPVVKKATARTAAAISENRLRARAAKKAESDKRQAAAEEERTQAQAAAAVEQPVARGQPPAQGMPLDSIRLHPAAWPLPQEFEYALCANKADRSLYVYAWRDSAWVELKRYPVAIGENGGPKMRAGDKRTPEGQYFIVGQKDKSEMSEIYGPVAYVLNYPNSEDIRAGRTGQGIWIHGTAPDSAPLSTRGCLEMNNRDLTDLAALLRFGFGTPILILNKEGGGRPADELNYRRIIDERKAIIDEYGERLRSFGAFVLRWKAAWESKDIERYAQFYSQGTFRGQGLSWESWREKKRRTFEVYSSITVNIDKLVLSECSRAVAVVKFVQEYASDAVGVTNGKRLTLVKEGDEWKISREDTFVKEELLL
mgnify:CR=1 FL=1